MPTINNKLSLLNPVHLLALGFGSGLSPKAPGTMGTLVAIPLLLTTSYLPLLYFVILTIFMSVIGIYLCGKTAQDAEVHDHQAIVWDEICGFFITMIAIPISWQSVIIGFILFRINIK